MTSSSLCSENAFEKSAPSFALATAGADCLVNLDANYVHNKTVASGFLASEALQWSNSSLPSLHADSLEQVTTQNSTAGTAAIDATPDLEEEMAVVAEALESECDAAAPRGTKGNDSDDDSDDDIDIIALLEEACGEIDYSIDELAVFLRSGDYPIELLQLLKQKSNSKSLASVRSKVEPQRAALLAKVEEALQILEAERKAARTREEKKRKEMVQTRIRQMGRCPMNFEWLPTSGGYRCAGGSHFISASEINFVD